MIKPSELMQQVATGFSLLRPSKPYRLNMELDLQSLFGLYVHS
jgi:hypothetical protein